MSSSWWYTALGQAIDTGSQVLIGDLCLMLQVLLKSDIDRKVVSAAVDPDQTAAVLKACIAEQQQLDRSTITNQLDFTGHEVPDGEHLKNLGLVSSTATIQGCGSQLFPNGWFESPFAKAFAKVQDITWPPLRQADFDVSLGWVLLLLGVLLWTQS